LVCKQYSILSFPFWDPFSNTVVDYDHVFPRGWATDIFDWITAYISKKYASSRNAKSYTNEIDHRFKILAGTSYPGIEKWPRGIYTERFSSSKYPKK
jgi:hypothetical protein